MSRFSLSALGVDQPGIVAGVSRALVDLGCNLEDSTMTILRGHFAILLVVAAPVQVTEEVLESALAPVAQAFDLTVAVRRLTDMDSRTGAPAEAGPDAEGKAQSEDPSRERAPGIRGHGTSSHEGEGWTIAVHGADRPGIVHAVASALADADANIVDLATHLVGDPAAQVYVMTLRATLPSGESGEAAAEHIRQAASALGVHCTVHPDEADLL